MKKIYFIFIIILLTNSNIWAQEIPKEVKKSNTMVIQLEQTSDEILNFVAKTLIQFDYEIDKLDKEYLTISTRPILAKNILNYYIKAKVVDHSVEFQFYSSMDITINGVSSEGYSLSNFKGQKGSPNYEASTKLYSVVNRLSPSIQFFEK